MDIVSMTLGAYLHVLNGKPFDANRGFIQVAEATVVVDADAKKLKKLAKECDIQTSIAMIAYKDDPLIEFDKACGAFHKFRDELDAKNKEKV